MRRWLIYIVLYAAVGVFGLSPFRSTDVASLSPVEVVWLESEDNEVRIETDAGDTGFGKTLSEALTDMKKTASATVFLDTADYLIIKKGSEYLLGEAAEVLRPSCSVCVAKKMPDLTEVASYLAIHEPSVKLKNISEAVQLPLLDEERGRLILVE